MFMKCLSLKQPYAELVARGRKSIELRTWNTKFRGRFLIHASRKTDIESCRRFKIDPERLQNGAIIGQACIYGVKMYRSKGEFMKDSSKHLATYKIYGKSRYGFLLKNSRRFRKPVRQRGMLNFFNVKWYSGVVHG